MEVFITLDKIYNFFDIAMEIFSAVEFLNFLLGQKFVRFEFDFFKCKDWSLEGKEGRVRLFTSELVEFGLIML